MIKELICINCPRGCQVKIDTDTKEVTGNYCKRGEEYAITEITCPKRTLTTSMRVEDEDTLISVRTDKPIPKELLFKAMEIINKTIIKKPVKMNQILIENILDSGVNIISTKEMK